MLYNFVDGVNWYSKTQSISSKHFHNIHTNNFSIKINKRTPRISLNMIKVQKTNIKLIGSINTQIQTLPNSGDSMERERERERATGLIAQSVCRYSLFTPPRPKSLLLRSTQLD